MNPVLDTPWMKVLDAAKRARSSRTEILSALADGSLLGYQNKPGGTWKIHRDDVDAWIRGEKPASLAARRAS